MPSWGPTVSTAGFRKVREELKVERLSDLSQKVTPILLIYQTNHMTLPSSKEDCVYVSMCLEIWNQLGAGQC